jgi:lathosterol oxidase
MSVSDVGAGGIFQLVLSEYFLRYWVAAGGVWLVVNLGLSGWISARRLRDTRLPDGQVLREIASSMRSLVIFGATGVVVVLGARQGWQQLYLDIAEYGWVYLVLSLVATILAHDAWFYWTHRLIHHPQLFRHLHRLHHRSNQTTPFTAFAFNTGEAVINALFVPVILLVLPLHPLAILIFGWHQMIRNAIGHSGFELFPARADGRPLFEWMTTVTHHDLHHSNARWNMGLYFTWWDRWMGTEHPDYHARFRATVTRRKPGAPQARPA